MHLLEEEGCRLHKGFDAELDNFWPIVKLFDAFVVEAGPFFKAIRSLIFILSYHWVIVLVALNITEEAQVVRSHIANKAF